LFLDVFLVKGKYQGQRRAELHVYEYIKQEVFPHNIHVNPEADLL